MSTLEIVSQIAGIIGAIIALVELARFFRKKKGKARRATVLDPDADARLTYKVGFYGICIGMPIVLFPVTLLSDLDWLGKMAVLSAVIAGLNWLWIGMILLGQNTRRLILKPGSGYFWAMLVVAVLLSAWFVYVWNWVW
jgi:hypothetical protein